LNVKTLKIFKFQNSEYAVLFMDLIFLDKNTVTFVLFHQISTKFNEKSSLLLFLGKSSFFLENRRKHDFLCIFEPVSYRRQHFEFHKNVEQKLFVITIRNFSAPGLNEFRKYQSTLLHTQILLLTFKSLAQF
jgi:hypothetical protein